MPHSTAVVRPSAAQSRAKSCSSSTSTSRWTVSHPSRSAISVGSSRHTVWSPAQIRRGTSSLPSIPTRSSTRARNSLLILGRLLSHQILQRGPERREPSPPELPASPRLHRGHGPTRLGHVIPTPRRQPDDLGPPVVGIRHPADVAPPLGVVHQQPHPVFGHA